MLTSLLGFLTENLLGGGTALVSRLIELLANLLTGRGSGILSAARDYEHGRQYENFAIVALLS